MKKLKVLLITLALILPAAISFCRCCEASPAFEIGFSRAPHACCPSPEFQMKDCSTRPEITRTVQVSRTSSSDFEALPEVPFQDVSVRPEKSSGASDASPPKDSSKPLYLSNRVLRL